MPLLSEDTRLIGREEELAHVRAFVTGETTEVDVLVVEGDAGIGKTAVWREALTSAPDARTARARETEASFAFAGLADALAALPEDVLAALPVPQRHALEVALLLRDAGGAAPEPHAVGAATLTALRALAPVVVGIDDMQWLDSASAAALEFAMRRLRTDDVRFLLTVRTPADDVIARLPDTRVERVQLRPLSFGAIQQLLAQRLERPLPRQVARRVHATSGGNPFFALELAANLVARGVERAAMRDVPIPQSVAIAVGDRLEDLDAETRAAVLATALLATPRVSTVTAATGSSDGIVRAAAAGLVDLEGESLRLRHPLYGSIVKERTPPAELRALHRALAELPLAAEERVRHLALGTEPPDLAVATALERAAKQAAERGAGIAAAELAEDAWRFTPLDSARRPELAIAAATRYGRVGMHTYARELLEHELPTATGELRVQMLFELARMGPHERLDLLDSALQGADGALRAEILAEKADTTATGNADQVVLAHRWATEAVALARASGDRGLVSRTLFALAWTEALLGNDPDSLLAEADAGADGNPSFDHPDRIRAVRSAWRGDTRHARMLLERLHDRARERDEEFGRVIFLNHLSELELRRGDFAAYAAIAERLTDAASPFGESHSILIRVRATLAIADGDVATASASVSAAEASGVGSVGWHALEARRAAGVAALFADEPERAAALLGAVDDRVRAADIIDPGAFPVGPDLVEALLRAGCRDEASTALERFEAVAERLVHPWATATALRARGLLEDDEALLCEALAALEQLDHPLEAARTRLALGVLRRRARRLREARAALETAVDAFDTLRVPVLAARARAELERIAGRRRTADGLTAAEKRVAALVAEGLANKEIADRLVVSVAAVEAHLTRIYAKLGVRGRTGLMVKVSGSPD